VFNTLAAVRKKQTRGLLVEATARDATTIQTTKIDRPPTDSVDQVISRSFSPSLVEQMPTQWSGEEVESTRAATAH